MKKTRLLLLLVPSFFLASCQTTPKIDTITEEEAIKFINEHFTPDKTKIANPNTLSIVKWEIKENEQLETVKGYVGNYINESPVADPKGEVGINESRCAKYVSELTDPDCNFDSPGYDAIIGMNPEVYKKLRNSGQNKIDSFELIYKPAGNGITIISQSTSTQWMYTRTHTYDEYGRETWFEVRANHDNCIFTMSIDFRY